MANYQIDFSDYTFIDFGTNTRARGGLHMTISNLKHSYRVAFSKEVAEQVQKKGLKNLRISVNKITGEFMIVFCNCEDPSIARVSNEKGGTLRLYSRPMIDFFRQKLHIPKKEFTLTYDLTEDLSQSNEYASFKIKQLHEKE